MIRSGVVILDAPGSCINSILGKKQQPKLRQPRFYYMTEMTDDRNKYLNVWRIHLGQLISTKLKWLTDEAAARDAVASNYKAKEMITLYLIKTISSTLTRSALSLSGRRRRHKSENCFPRASNIRWRWTSSGKCQNHQVSFYSMLWYLMFFVSFQLGWKGRWKRSGIGESWHCGGPRGRWWQRWWGPARSC